MSAQPQHQEALVRHDALRRHLAAVLAAAGLPVKGAAIVSDSLVDADLRGVHSHGTVRVPYYVERLRTGGNNARPRIRVVSEGPAYALLDGDDGMGQVVAQRCVRVAVEKSRASGIGWVICRRSSHFGAAAYWAVQAVSEGMIGFAATNTIASMFPFGGAAQVVGNNPICYAIPAGKNPPVILDMAMSVAAGGKVAVLKAKGQPIPEGWLLDSLGRPTTDPNAVASGGAVAPIGGPKGFGLALMMDVICGVLSGANFAGTFPPRGPADRFGSFGAAADARFGNGHNFMAIDISRFMPLGEFTTRMEALVATVKSARRAPGVDRIYLPGEIEHDLKRARLEAGIPLPATVLEALAETALELGVEPLASAPVHGG